MSERSLALQLLAMKRVVPFHYEHDNRTFVFGEEHRAVHDMQRYGQLHGQGENMTAQDVENLMGTAAFVGSFNMIHSFPLAEDFLETQWTTGLDDETRTIMMDVYNETRAWDTSYDDPAPFDAVLSSFGSLRYRRDVTAGRHAGIKLHAPGSCTCLGPDYVAEHNFSEHGVMTYTEHNVISLTHKVSLMAGLGHIAGKANTYAATTVSSRGHTAAQ